MAKKHITTDDLAAMVNKGFNGVGKRFDEVDKRFDEVKKQIGGLDERVENIEKLLLKQHAFQIQNLEKRMKRVEDLFAVK
jgi:archaellum component FlaC